MTPQGWEPFLHTSSSKGWNAEGGINRILDGQGGYGTSAGRPLTAVVLDRWPMVNAINLMVRFCFQLCWSLPFGRWKDTSSASAEEPLTGRC